MTEVQNACWKVWDEVRQTGWLDQEEIFKPFKDFSPSFLDKMEYRE